MTTHYLKGDLPRGAYAARCPCGGYAEACDDDPTPDEDKQAGGCGRVGCCTRAFLCGLCGARVIAPIEAPEADSS